MGFTRERTYSDGDVRFMAVYRDLKGRVRSAGTYRKPEQADRAWQEAESKVRQGRLGDPKRGRMKFERYVLDIWLPNHVMEAKTREGYTYAIRRHIMPEFGSMRMIDVLPEHVRLWIATQQANPKIGASTIQHNKVILSAIFTTAFNDQVIFLHPCKGVKTPTVPVKPRVIITPEQFDKIYQALADADAQLLVETGIESGLRWGELTELRVKDLDFESRILTVSRAVVEMMNPKLRDDGRRFVVKQYPKGKKHRKIKLSTQIVEKLKAHKDSENLGQDDLLFAIRHQVTKTRKFRVVPNPDELGLTEPNEEGRQYKHGTMSGYGAGKCRCEHCQAAVAIYRAARRTQGKDNPRRPRLPDTDGHIPNNHFRNTIWNKAAEKAGLGKIVEKGEANKTGKKAKRQIVADVRIHDLRHAHASWLLAGGADLQVVKERLGHGSIATTERYLHTLPEADETALEAFSKIRYRAKR